MTPAGEMWLEHQRKRFMRPDAHRYVRPDAARFMRPQADRSPPVAVVEAQHDFSLIEAERQELLAAKALVAELKFHLALRRFSRKYREDQPRDDRGRWVDDPNGNQADGSYDHSDSDDSATDFSAARRLPRIPDERPPQSSDRTAIAKEVAGWLKENAGAVVSTIITATSWLHDAIPNIVSYFDRPRALEELQQGAAEPKAGYDVHHIVEQSSARADGYPASKIDAPENLVRIPRMKHWDMNAWYQSSNEAFGYM
jgi:hypothetical protein